uniref:DNA-processing protein DprA n=1 Tax=Neobacillus citreus TaxID=2833578 RepID=A0A942T0P4_9BACI
MRLIGRFWLATIDRRAWRGDRGVEAAVRSGAINTAHHALQLGRPLFAVPGAFASAASVGCHRLIAAGHAQIVVAPSDPAPAAVQGDLAFAEPSAGTGADAGAVALGTRRDPHVTRVLDALDRRPLPAEEIARRSGLAVDDVVDALALAQLEQLATPTADGWCRP